jgi:phenylacetate-coenzyme A ligase PaaK-like adenylate-forming protein
VRIVIAIGEPINSEFRAMIEEVWSCNICSFYGTTEIGGFAGECESKDGLHFDPELIVPTIISPSHYDAQSVEGEVCFTTLHISTHSVVKYAVGDIVRLSTIACACGEASPRLWFKSRCQEAFILAGEKFNYSMFLQVLMEIAPDTSLMTIEIEDSEQCDGTALIRFVLPDNLRDREKSIRDAFENGIFEFDALCRYGLVQIELAFRPLTCVAGRKLLRLSDRRIFVPGTTVAGEPNLRGGREK